MTEPHGPAGVLDGGTYAESNQATREVSVCEVPKLQPEIREDLTGQAEMAERLVVVMKPGNAGGAKEPWFKVSERRSDNRRLT
jgi:hypothetical protein